ncbi:MAG: amidohydrolase [gamma proteobacterium symbiont of Bathyaustriella thionipta]|nr:amidohydrolase [gamma proteobacterium symbiont of Bathyaustriella thionipta]
MIKKQSRKSIHGRLFSIFCVWLALSSMAQAVESPAAWAQQHLSGLKAYYHEFHAHPELSFQETGTSARLAAAWKSCGYQISTGLGSDGVSAGKGIVGLLHNGSGPVVMMRADMDALPIAEQTGLPFASKVQTLDPDGIEVPVMHACGHDAHMVSIIGTACYLAANRSLWKGTIMLVGQPAEETGSGARALLEDGLFERFPRPNYALGLHVSPVLAAGKVAYRAGYTMANVDSVNITLYGRGGHGAYPHATIDPVVEAAELIMSLQTIVSRMVDPVEPAVVTVGAIHAGTKNNVIGDSAKLKLTVRTFSAEVRKQVLAAIERKARAVAMGAGAPEPLVTIAMGTPSLFNDLQLSARMRPVLKQQLGAENVEILAPTMGGDDFSRYGWEGVPSLMYWLGAVKQERLDAYAAAGETPPSLHSASFYPDEDETLKTGVVLLSSSILELLKP